MNKRVMSILSVLLMMMSAACNHSDNGQVQESFRDFTTSTFAVSADQEAVDIEGRDFDFDIGNEDDVIEQLVINNEFSV